MTTIRYTTLRYMIKGFNSEDVEALCRMANQ